METTTKCLNAGDFIKDWNSWRSTLSEAIRTARKIGMSDEMIAASSVKMGNFLAQKICPSTKEEELLKEMWDQADPQERKTLARIIFKMVEKEGSQETV